MSTPDPLAFLTNPTDERIQAARGRSCDICKSKVGEWCSNTIQPDQPLPGRLVHVGRGQAPRSRRPMGTDSQSVEGDPKGTEMSAQLPSPPDGCRWVIKPGVQPDAYWVKLKGRFFTRDAKAFYGNPADEDEFRRLAVNVALRILRDFQSGKPADLLRTMEREVNK